MTWWRGLLGVVPLLLCVAAQALAQTQIPQEVVQSPTALTTQQVREIIEPFVSQQIQALTASEATDEQITGARAALVEQMQRPGATPHFLRAFSSAVSARIGPAVTAERDLVGINALIVCAYLRDTGAVEPVTQGLTAANPARRYWAAKAAAAIAQQPLADAQKQALLTALQAALNADPPHPVVGQLLVALVNLGAAQGNQTFPQAHQALVEQLNHRVASHVNNPGMPMGPERTALEEAYRNLVQAGPAAPAPVVRQLVRASYRFLSVAASQLDDGVVPRAAEPSYRDMVKLTDTVLRWAVPEGTADRPDPITVDVNEGNWAAVRVAAQTWGRALAGDPFKFTPEELAIPEATEAGSEQPRSNLAGP